ncbi:pyruvate dehydrogenase complex dihydrolipoamide acetyltransferase [Pendulispora brunnea]|uniref:Acetyltransferase component of pyruvate dehydrogenase complex n=1 Tax=Pendulispora brunnea TaxID=2905690 RepID=A0ABZ2KHU7_9BACT
MAKILDMPKLSPTMEEGVLTAWHKKEGDEVNVDDLLAEVETDKATMEFRAFDKGVLLKLLVADGAEVKLGQPVAILGKAGEDVSALLSQVGSSAPAAADKAAEKPAAEKPAAAPAPAAADKAAAAAGASVEVPQQAQAQGPVPPPVSVPREKGSALDRTEREGNGRSRAHASAGRIFASPYVRRAARERGIDLQGAQGSGPGGRVVAKDLDTMASRPAAAPASANGHAVHAPAAPAAPGYAEPEVRPLSMMRKTIARRLTESKKNVPHFYLTIDVDVEKLVAFREQINAELEAAAKKAKTEEKPAKVSVNDLLVKACAVALGRVPECNAQFTPEAILVHKRIDISVAVAVPEGLVTPVVRNADQKSVVAISSEVRELAGRAKAKKLKAEEMQDGTFSISNLGMFGIDAFSAVINPPEGAILAVGKVREEPVVREGQVVPGKKLAMTLSCDHRVVDGAVGAAFLAELRSLLEHPMRIVTG